MTTFLKPLALVLMISATFAAPPQQPPGGLAFTATLDSIKINARPGQVVTRQFRLTLEPKQPRTHFKAHVEDFWRSEDGKQSFYAEPGKLKRSCGPWVSVNPAESAVSGGETVVRLTVNVPPEGVAGGYWCALTVDEVPDPLAKSEGVGVKFLASVSTGVFLYLDPVERAAKILDVQVDGERATVRVRNEGNTPLGIEGRVEFWTPGAKAATATIDVPRGTLLTEPSIEGVLGAALPAPAALPSGRYLVRAILDFGGDHLIGAERELAVTRATPVHAPVR